MKIRDELKQKGFSDDEIDRYVYEAYERKKREAIQSREKLINKLTTSPIERTIDRLIRRLAWISMQKGQSSSIPKFTGDKNNPIEIFEYNQRYGIKPIKTIENEDGTYTHIYEDGLTVNVEVNLSGISIPSNEELRQMEIDERRFLAEVLDIDEQYAINTSNKKIKKLVLKNEKKFSKKLF